MSESHASTLKFQDYFTSPLFTILVGKNEFPFTVHSEVLRDKIPVLYAAIDKEGSSENGTKVIRWADRAPETIASLVQWLYTGEYECILPVVLPRCPAAGATSNSPEPDHREAASLEPDCEDANSNGSQDRDSGHGSTPPAKPDNAWRAQSTLDEAENPEDEGDEEELESLEGNEEEGSFEGNEEESLDEGEEGLESEWSEAEQDTFATQTDALHTAVDEAQAQLNKLKTNNETALSAALESISTSSFTCSQTPALPGEAPSIQHLKHQLANFARTTTLTLAALREQQENLTELRICADEAKKAAEKAELEAKSARFASMIAQPTTAETPARSGTKDRDEQRTLHAAHIVREISKALPPDPFLLGTTSDLHGKQLSKLQTQLSIMRSESVVSPPGKWAPRRDSIDRELSLLQHVKVYGLAQSLGVSDLEEFAVHAIHILLDVVNYCVFVGEAIAMRNVVCLIKAVYKNTAAGRLRESVSRFAALKHRKLLGCLEYAELLQSGGVFVVDLAVNLERCPTSEKVTVPGISSGWMGPSFGKEKVLFSKV